MGTQRLCYLLALVCCIDCKKHRLFGLVVPYWDVIISVATRAIILIARYMCLAAEGLCSIELDLAICPHPSLALNPSTDPYPALYSGFVGMAVGARSKITSRFGLLS